MPMPDAIYIHVPFCRAKCAYCDFNSYARMESLGGRYVAALCAELSAITRQEGRPLPVRTIYLGGGTPSLLPPALIGQGLDACRTLDIAPDAEVSLEANPGTVSIESLRALRKAGINRLSLGFQSLDDASLRVLGRIHTAAEAVAAYEMARRAGFDNITLDFIYGFPGQDLGHWKHTLAEAVALQPDNLSLYGLTLEPGTPMASRVERGLITLPDEDTVAD